jgi:hypothetical protein
LEISNLKADLQAAFTRESLDQATADCKSAAPSFRITNPEEQVCNTLYAIVYRSGNCGLQIRSSVLPDYKSGRAGTRGDVYSLLGAISKKFQCWQRQIPRQARKNHLLAVCPVGRLFQACQRLDRGGLLPQGTQQGGSLEAGRFYPGDIGCVHPAQAYEPGQGRVPLPEICQLPGDGCEIQLRPVAGLADTGKQGTEVNIFINRR